MHPQKANFNRREFLRQSFAFSALATVGAHNLLAAPPDPAATHILMFGDWGYEEDFTGQRSVAASMTKYAQANKLRTDAIFMLGDSWYGALPGGPDDVRFKTQFEEMYPASVFPGPAYSIMGNHDYQHIPAGVSKREAELAYAKRGHTRWTQPALWYTFDLPQMKVIALDSNVPTGHKPDAVNFTLTPEEEAQQLAWFAAELDKPTSAPFTVVMGHHPVFSNGPHGDHKTLIADWEPLLRKHKVAAYLAGHDHDLQHLEFEDHPTSFVCSGAGGADLYNLKITQDQRGPYAKKVYGFTHLEATGSKLTFRHIDADGNTLHSFSKERSGKVSVQG
jgi:tartrate-resistant acid phosphatase type 5